MTSLKYKTTPHEISIHQQGSKLITIMKDHLLPAVLFLVIIFSPAQSVLAKEQANPEEELLSMYFSGDDLVETATQSPKPLYQVAENVTIVTAEEIQAMHAHTLAEVLSRQAGVFVNFFGQDFLGDSSLMLLGSDRHHVLFLLDGVRLNLNSNGSALTSFVPLGIIKRIEIIKGAASSTWGSALGGVINIITKDVGKTNRPTGSVNTSYGQANSRDISADAAGKVGMLGYYLYGGNINSDGLRLDRYSDRDSVYGKMQLPLPHGSRLTVTGGYSDPKYKNLNWANAYGIDDLNIYEDADHQNTWGTIFFDSELTQRLTLHLSGQHFDNTYAADIRSLGNGLGGSYGELIYGQEWKDQYNSFAGRFTWAGESLTANLGFESSHSEMSYKSQLGEFFGGGGPSEDDPVEEDRHGVYGNITYLIGKFSITPGLRYDYHSNSEESLNPSLGLTYLLSPDTLLRGSIAKGFSAPYLSASADSPDLKPETTWTYQAGIETARIPYIRFKGTIFHQNIEDAWYTDAYPLTNSGSMRLNGFEIETKTDAYQGLSLTANFSYVIVDSYAAGITMRDGDETYTGNLIFAYLNATYGLRTEIAGHYYWMSDDVVGEESENDDFLWDLLIAKDFTFTFLSGEVYLKGHNLFNGNQYFDVDYPNPRRWVEAGISFTF